MWTNNLYQGQWWRLNGYALLGFLIVSTTGCITLDDVHVDDDEALARTASLVIRPETMKWGRNQGGVEFDYERYRGSGMQKIDFQHYVQLDNAQIIGPMTIDATADTEIGRVAYNHLIKFGSHLELEPSLGVTYERTIFTVQSRLPGAQLHSIEDNGFGVGIGFMPRFNLNRFIGVEGQVGAMIDEDGDYSYTRHIAVVLSPIHNIMLRGGYYWRDADVESRDGYSDFETDFEGVLASVTLQF